MAVLDAMRGSIARGRSLAAIRWADVEGRVRRGAAYFVALSVSACSGGATPDEVKRDVERVAAQCQLHEGAPFAPAEACLRSNGVELTQIDDPPGRWRAWHCRRSDRLLMAACAVVVVDVSDREGVVAWEITPLYDGP